MNRKLPFDLILVFAISATVQLIYLYEASRHDPTFRALIIDAGSYHDAAIRFAEGRPFDSGVYGTPPLLMMLMGIVYRVVGPDPTVVKLLFVFMNSLSCSLTALIARRLWGPLTGVFSGISLALYGPFIFFGAQLLPAAPAIFFTMLAVERWSAGRINQCLSTYLTSGLAFGLATVTVVQTIFLAIPLLVLEFMESIRRTTHTQNSTPNNWQRFLGLLVGILIVVSPVVARNCMATGELVGIATNGGVNLFVGNNENSAKTMSVRPGEEWLQLRRMSYTNRAATGVEEDRFFRRKVVEYASSQPISYLNGLARKSLELLNSREIPRSMDPFVHRQYSTLLLLLMWRIGSFGFPWGIVAPLSVLGVVATLCDQSLDQERRHFARVLLWSMLLFVGTIVLFFVSSRYRLPLVPFVLIFASRGLLLLVSLFRTAHSCNSSRPPIVAIASAIVMLLIANMPITTATDQNNFTAELHLAVGSVHANQHRFDLAERYLFEALRLETRYSEALCALARVRIQQENFAEAESLLRTAMDIDTQTAEPRWLLGGLLRHAGRLPDALAVLEHGVTVDPKSPHAHAAVADALADIARAKLNFSSISDSTVANDPNSADANRVNPNRTATARERPDSPAISSADQSGTPIVTDLPNIAASNKAATVRERSESPFEPTDVSHYLDRANQHYARAVALNPDAPDLRLRFGEFLLEQERFADALFQFRSALDADEQDLPSLHAAAWLLSTCPQTELRDCRQAIELTLRAIGIVDVSDQQTSAQSTTPPRELPALLDTLAAAYATCGQFNDAIQTARRAVEIARTINDPSLADILARLAMYESAATDH